VNELKHKTQGKSVDAHNIHASAVNIPEKDAIGEIANALSSVYSKLEREPAYVYGRIRHFLAVHKSQLGELQTREPSEAATVQSLEEKAIQRASVRSEVTESIEGDDLPLVIEEETRELRKRLNYNFLPWINDRKLVFEAKPDRANAYIYGALGSLFGAYLLYKIYQGDATNASLLAIFAASSFCFSRHRINTIRNSFDYLVQMNVHRDGRTLDLFIQRTNNQIAKIEGVPVSDFKVHRSDYQFDFPENGISRAIAQGGLGRSTSGVRLSDMRKYGLGRNAWVGTYGQDIVLVPMDYLGNSAVLNNVFKGKDLEFNA